MWKFKMSQQRTIDRMYVDKRDLVTFIAGVVNSTAENQKMFKFSSLSKQQ